MGGINSLSGLNKVSVDFRPAITMNAQNTGNAAPPLPEVPVAPEDVPPEMANARSVVRELDVLLLNAAGKSVSADVVTNVKTVGASLVTKGVLTQKQASRLESLAEDAKSKLQALDKFSGRELAKALMPDKKTGETVWSRGFFGMNAAAKAVTAAIEAQQKLSAELGKFNDLLAGSEQVDAALQDAFTELQFQCDRRASEIDSVVFRMYDLAQQDVVNGVADDPQIKALLDATFKELMPREAIMMHGTAEAFEKLNANLAAQMRPLAEKLDAFAADGSKVLGNEEILAIQRDMATMKNAIANVRANGIEVGDGRIEVDKSLLNEMERILSDVSNQIANTREVAAMRSRQKFMEELKASLSPEKTPGGDKVWSSAASLGNSAMSAFRRLRREFCELIRDYAIGNLSLAQFDTQMDACIAKFNGGMFDNFEGVLLSIGFDADTAEGVAKTVRGLHLVKAQFKELMESTEKLRKGGEDPGLATDDVRRIMLGEVGLSNVVEAKARGFKPGDVDPATEESNIVSSRTLGSGAAGKTYLLTTKSGEELVFKPELDSRIGLSRLALGTGGAYVDKQNTANLNLATQDTAKAFGCEDLVVKYSVGSHDGQFGIFMEKAKGYSGGDFVGKKTTGGGGITPADMHKIEDENEQTRIQGSIAQKLNKLMWLDMITGQGDRHWNNYFVGVEKNVEKNTYDVTVKGIDNDASFSSRQVGLRKYALDKKNASEFDAVLQHVCFDIFGKRGWENEYRSRVSRDPGLVKNADGSMTVDLVKAKSPEIKMAILEVLGMHNIALPTEIDKDFYDKLMEMDRDPAKKQAYLDSIAPRISKEALTATEMRLNEAIEHAKELNKANKVYGDAQWRKQSYLDQMAAPKNVVKIEKSDGTTISVSTKIEFVKEFSLRNCPSLYKRDFFQYMFDKPDQK